jgi:hypothetical protein
MIHAAYHWLVILAHRPLASVVRPAVGTNDIGAEAEGDGARELAIKRCERSAMRIVTIWTVWCAALRLVIGLDPTTHLIGGGSTASGCPPSPLSRSASPPAAR